MFPCFLHPVQVRVYRTASGDTPRHEQGEALQLQLPALTK